MNLDSTSDVHSLARISGFHRNRDGITIAIAYWSRALSVVLYKQRFGCTWNTMLSKREGGSEEEGRNYIKYRKITNFHWRETVRHDKHYDKNGSSWRSNITVSLIHYSASLTNVLLLYETNIFISTSLSPVFTSNGRGPGESPFLFVPHSLLHICILMLLFIVTMTILYNCSGLRGWWQLHRCNTSSSSWALWKASPGALLLALGLYCLLENKLLVNAEKSNFHVSSVSFWTEVQLRSKLWQTG